MFVEVVNPNDIDHTHVARHGSAIGPRISSESFSWQFYYASFKLRFVIEVATMAQLLTADEATQLSGRVEAIESKLLDIARAYGLSSDPVLTATCNEVLKRSGPLPENVLATIRDWIVQLPRHIAGPTPGGLDLVRLFQERMDGEYVPFPGRAEMMETITPKYDFLNTDGQSYALADLLGLWNGDTFPARVGVRPRHLLGMLAPDTDGSEAPPGRQHAIVTAIAHHPWIINRYMRIRS